MFNVQNQDLAAEAQKAAGLQDELDAAKGFEEKAVSELIVSLMLSVYSLMLFQQKKFNILMESYKKKKGKCSFYINELILVNTIRITLIYFV